MKYEEKTIGYKTTKTNEYDSIGDFMAAINAAAPNKFFQSNYDQQSKSLNGSWSGTRSWEEAVTLFTQGWSPAAERINRKLHLSAARPEPTQKPRPTYDVVGAAASVPRYLQGIPTNMVRMKNTAGPIRIVTITKDISYNAGFKNEKILEEGVKVMRIIKALEEQNIKCKLNVYMGSCVNNEILACKVCIKRPEERINILKIAFPMAHTSMLRRFIFRWIETNPNMTNSFVTHYGMPNTLSPAKNEYYIPLTILDVEKFVQNVLK